MRPHGGRSPCPPRSFTSRRPRTAPLFPYTTLFRSHRLVVGTRLEGEAALAGGRGEVDRVALLRATEPREPGGCQEDRKSTRLNSSHRTISYAVFCLKKKRRPFDIRCQRAEGVTQRR